MTTSSTVTARSPPTPSGEAMHGAAAAAIEANHVADGDRMDVLPSNLLRKRDSEEDGWSSCGYNYINPFVHRLEIDNRMDLAKIYVLTVLLLPLRFVGCILSLLSAWMFACIGQCGMTQEDLNAKPLSGWRKNFQYLTAKAMRMVYASGSFHHVTFKGTPATAKEAPVLVVAPHSSYVDSLVVVATGPPSIVPKKETSQIPLLGKVINLAQPIYVQREDPNSRQNTIREIVHRARSNENWPQVVIFPEGTCTNRKALIQFKAGAFYPGVPVQPVLLRYPNKYDTFTWTWDGPGVLHLLWKTMSQFYSRCEIEYLPVYTPSEEEKMDANLYARNVREVMAKALNVPTSEYSFEDVIVMSRAKDMRIPFPGDIVEIERIIYHLGLMDTNLDSKLANDFLSLPNVDNLDFLTFGELLQVDLKNSNLHHLFALLDHQRVGKVSLKSFLLCLIFCKVINDDIHTFLQRITPIYSASSRDITRENFVKLMKHSGRINADQANIIFYAIDQTNKGFVSIDDFENYCKNLPEYNFLFKKQKHIRRQHKNL